MTKNTLSIVIPTYGNKSRLELLLNSIFKAKIPKSLIEIIVVENGQKFNAETICNRISNNVKVPITYLYLNEANLGKARNFGTKNSSGSWILFLDDDIRIHEDCLISYEEGILEADQKIVAFMGGPLMPDYEQKPEDWLIEFLPFSAKGLHLGEKKFSINTPILLGGNIAVSRAVFDSEHRFDLLATTGPNSGFVGEETRLQDVLLKKGFKGWYIPGGLVFHYVPKDRCSVSWLRHRNLRSGETTGYLSEDSLGPLLLGAPRWMWRKLVMNQLKYWWFTITGSDKRKRIEILVDVEYLKGVVNGIRKKGKYKPIFG